MSRLLLFITVLILGASTAKAMPYTNAEEGDFKFGTKGVLGLFYEQSGAFVEYKLNQNLGIESGLVFNRRDVYAIKDSLGTEMYVNPKHLSIPLTLRVYPGKDRQSSLFFGFQVGYLVGGKSISKEYVKKNKSMVEFAFENSIGQNIKEDPDKSNFALIFELGYSYEFNIGLILGANAASSITSALKTKAMTLMSYPNLYVGWNLARLLKN